MNKVSKFTFKDNPGDLFDMMRQHFATHIDEFYNKRIGIIMTSYGNDEVFDKQTDIFAYGVYYTISDNPRMNTFFQKSNINLYKLEGERIFILLEDLKLEKYMSDDVISKLNYLSSTCPHIVTKLVVDFINGNNDELLYDIRIHKDRLTTDGVSYV